MIDYEKLKICHQLAQTLSNKTECSVHIEVVFHELSAPEFVLIDASSNPDGEAYRDIDVLIKELHFLTQDKPKPKYAVESPVFYLEDNKMIEFIVKDIYFDGEGYSYIDCEDNEGQFDVIESALYPSKQSLIESQIEHWINELKSLPEFKKLTGQYILSTKDEECVDTQMNQDEVDLHECQHDQDNDFVDPGCAGIKKGIRKKCKHCGEFYK